MASVRSRDNKSTEKALGHRLWANGIRGYRKQWPVSGKPDFAWPGRKIAVFVDGCFWHGCTCKRLPRTNRAFWRNKIDNNVRRDKATSRRLRQQGWVVIRVKECRVQLRSTLTRIAQAILRRSPA